MENKISELTKEINRVKKCADDASKKCMVIMRKEMADVVKAMSEDMNEIKTSLAEEATKLQTAIEAKLVVSVGKEEVFSWNGGQNPLPNYRRTEPPRTEPPPQGGYTPPPHTHQLGGIPSSRPI